MKNADMLFHSSFFIYNGFFICKILTQIGHQGLHEFFRRVDFVWLLMKKASYL